MSISTIISTIVSKLEDMTTTNDYIYNCGTVQEFDINKIKVFPSYYVILPVETAIPNYMNNFRNNISLEIHCLNKVTSETNSIFNINNILNNMLHDVKKMIGNNPTLDGLVDVFDYTRSTRIPNNGNDIIIPSKLIVTCNVFYWN